MRNLLISLVLLSTGAAFASESCIHKFGPKTYRPKVVCDTVTAASLNTFRSIGWVQEDKLLSAKLCIYDEQFFGDMNPDRRTLENRDKAVTVKLISEYADRRGNASYEDINVLAAYNDYLRNGRTSKLVIMGKSWQSFDVDDKLEVNINNETGEVLYFQGLNSYLTFTGFKYKAHIKLKFSNCVYY